MIIGTAGHVDHGKTALVKALTGIDADRLAEEKRRGITIDLGYAYTDTPNGTLGFVDVPGHERFVHTMLAGASGIDAALFVVALRRWRHAADARARAYPATARHRPRRRGADQGRPRARSRGGGRRAGTCVAGGDRARRDAAAGGVRADRGGHRGAACRAARPRSSAARQRGLSAPGGGPRLHAGRRRARGHRHAGRRSRARGRSADAVAAWPRAPRARPACAEPAGRRGGGRPARRAEYRRPEAVEGRRDARRLGAASGRACADLPARRAAAAAGETRRGRCGPMRRCISIWARRM